MCTLSFRVTPNKRKVYTNEDLTKTREKLSYECRKLKKESNLKSVEHVCLFTLDDQENRMGETCSDDPLKYLKNEIRSPSRKGRGRWDTCTSPEPCGESAVLNTA